MRRVLYFIFTVTIVCIFSMPIISLGSDNTVPNIGSRLELFVDDYIIDSMTGVRQILHKPIPHEVVLVHDKPWEGSGGGYNTIFQDGGIYRMYYHGWHLNVDEDGVTTPHPFFGVYAESSDGKSWIKRSN